MSDESFCCDLMRQFVGEGLVRYDERYNEYNLIVREDEDTQTLQKINFCPWSGDPLPPSLRDKWFDELEAMGVDPMNDPIPPLYQDNSWQLGKTLGSG